MKLVFLEYIEKVLARAKYEYDPSVRQWVAWIDGFPGIYAQGMGVEEVRQELTSTLEEHILLGLKEGKRLPGFAFSRKIHAKTT